MPGMTTTAPHPARGPFSSAGFRRFFAARAAADTGTEVGALAMPLLAVPYRPSWVEHLILSNRNILADQMAFLKNQGLKYVIIKAATSDYLFPSDDAPQFTAEVVDAGHAAGLWVFGYNRSDGLNIRGEIEIADYVFNTGADGFVFDAEAEWESYNLANNTNKAIQLCSAVRSNWPNKFIALSTWGYRAFHSSFPYKEFAYYCDTIMPQDYWIEFGDSATESVERYVVT